MIENIDFEDIRSYRDDEYREKMAALILEPTFKKVIATVMPEVDYELFCQKMLSLNTIADFQKEIIAPFLHKLISQTANGL